MLQWEQKAAISGKKWRAAEWRVGDGNGKIWLVEDGNGSNGELKMETGRNGELLNGE